MNKEKIMLFKAQHELELKTINECLVQKNSVYKQLKYGIIEPADAAKEIEMITNKERNLKKKLVLEVHVTNDGRPRKISYSKSKELWYTILPGKDKQQIYAPTELQLFEKLFDVYGLKFVDMSIGGVFQEAILQKSLTDNNNIETINRYKYDYSRYISSDFAMKDIRQITAIDLKAYTQELVNRLQPTKKAFFCYKSVLNLIFAYAMEHELIYTNPVNAIVNKRYYRSCTVTPPSSAEKILSPDEIDMLKERIRQMMDFKTYNGYFINGYAILLSIETGMRAGELPALKWSDVHENYLHIHAQQLYHVQPGGKKYYYAPWTKNERENTSRRGRKFPLTNSIRDILDELKALQDERGIVSDYILCHEDGDWIKTDAYETCLRRVCRNLGFTVTNNHALRMSLNSNVFIPLNIPVTKRAELLGHSVETNLKYYSYAAKNDIDDICDLLNSANEDGNLSKCHRFPDAGALVQPHSNPILLFSDIKKSRNA